jgi:ABC-type lipoprotein release transport system permease subunit
LASEPLGISPQGPATISTVIMLLLIVALCAGMVSARRAMRIDPERALRHE